MNYYAKLFLTINMAINVPQKQVIKTIKTIPYRLSFSYTRECSITDLTYERDNKEVSYEEYHKDMTAIFGKYADAIGELIGVLIASLCEEMPVYYTDEEFFDDELGASNADVVINSLINLFDNYAALSSFNAIYDEAERYARNHGLMYYGTYEFDYERFYVYSYIMPNEPWNAYIMAVQEMQFYEDEEMIIYDAEPYIDTYIYVLNHRIKPEPECMTEEPPKECLAG